MCDSIGLVFPHQFLKIPLKIIKTSFAIFSKKEKVVKAPLCYKVSKPALPGYVLHNDRHLFNVNRRNYVIDAGWPSIIYVLQNVGRVPNRAYQSAVHAAQDEESKDSLMKEMRCRKGNVDTHSMRIPGVRKVKDADLGLCHDGSRTNKRGEAERDRGPR